MARDYYDESKKKVTAKKRSSSAIKNERSTASKKARQNQKSYGTTTPKVKTKTTQPADNRTIKSPATQQRSSSQSKGSSNNNNRTQNKLTLQERQSQKSYGSRTGQQSRQQQTPQKAQNSAAERRKNAETNNNLKQTEARRRREERAYTSKEMMERRKAAQEQKSGTNAINRPSEETKTAANRAVKNTPGLVKKALKDTGSGYVQALDDVTEMIAKNEHSKTLVALKLGQDPNDKKVAKRLEEDRQKTIKAAREQRKKLAAAQDKRQEEWDKKTKDAKGVEKAYYGAVESGTGMLADTAIGAATGTGLAGSLTSMGVRTYGTTRGQAEKEGATEDEDRRYALLQAGKEVGTELMFPGAGLAKKAYGRAGASIGEKAANLVLKNLKGPAAELASSGARLLGGVLEENVEEAAGWGLDPIIKEYTYGKNVRNRNKESAKLSMRESSEALRANIQNEDDVRAAAAYLSSDDFIEQTKQSYIDSGLGEDDAAEIAEKMRDYLSASIGGDTKTMAEIEDEVSEKMFGKHRLRDDYDFGELRDTIASTTLLTGVTGLPGTVKTSAQGAAIKEQLGSKGISALAKTAVDFEDPDVARQAKAMQERIESGKELTNTQAYDLQVAMNEQVKVDMQREKASRSMAGKAIEDEKLVAPYAVDRSGNIQLDEVTAKAYSESAKEAEGIIRSLESEGKESLTDTQVDTGSRAIAGFQTGVFTIDNANALNYSNTTIRAAFQAATGVNLQQYVVKNSDGSVNIPVTNTATKDALFAMAADNLVKSAQAETVNWMDNTKGQVVTQVSARMGAEGSAALQQALDDVDERDRSAYMMTANATDMLYQAARNLGTEWSDVKGEAMKMFPGISESKLQMMYEAGLADRELANDKMRDRQVNIGESVTQMGEQETATGKVFIDTTAPMKGTAIRTFTEIAQNLGADIHLTDEILNVDGTAIDGANGAYDPKTNTFYLNVSTGVEKNVGYIFMHEITHYLKNNAPEQYQELENLVREKWFQYNPSQMQDAIAKKIAAYERATGGKQVLTEEEALEEIIADAAHEFLNDPNFAQQVAEEDPSLAKAVLDSIRNALRMLRRIFGSGTIDDVTYMNSLFSEIGILDEAERLWLEAYKQAVRNQSAASYEALSEDCLKLAVGKTVEGRDVVVVNDTIFDDAYTEKENIQHLKDELSKRGRIPVKGQIVTLSRRGQKEAAHSKSAMALKRTDPQAYQDKLDAFAHPFDVIYATTNFVNESPNHPRTDKYVQFGRGEVLLQVHGRQYEANVLCGITNKGECELYDITGMTPTSFTMRKYSINEKETASHVEANGQSVRDASSLFDDIVSPEELEDNARYSIVEDPETIALLEADEHRTTYRAMALIDGKLYPPMATQIRDENGKWTLQQGIEEGQWIESDITTDSKMFDKDGKFHLKKDGGGDVYAAYNPYIHSSDSMLNDQFATAYKRPNIVVVEGIIPESELTSGYRAEHDLDDGRHVVAKDTTGITDWKAGVVQGQLSGKRTVFLTQHFKPTRIVPDAEVAEHIGSKVAGTDIAIPYNVVTPGVRSELQKQGVKMQQSKESKYYVDVSEDGMIRQGDDARWTDERIDYLIREYGASNKDYAQAYAAMISPEDYLKLTLSEDLLQKWEANPNEEIYDLDEEKLSENTQTPFLIIRASDGAEADGAYRVDGHEGRHRMRALMRAGIKSVPVAIKDTTTKYSKQHEDSMTLASQDFGYDPINDDARVTVTDLVPINNVNRDELIEKFGGDAQIRFSLPEYTQEEMDAHRQALVENAEESYGEGEGYTYEYDESGYVFPDGQMLRMGMYGTRGDDHAIATWPYDDIDYATTFSPKAEAQKRFINEGNIRYMPENGALNMGVQIEPTYEQYSWIRQFARDRGVSCIEFTDEEGNSADYKAYEFPDAEEVVNDIKRFYRNGRIGGSDLSQFRYSVTPEMDAEYMQAVDGGDIEKAQRLVDEAARAAGMRVAHRFHGTLSYGFNVFDKAKANVGGNSGAGFYFSTNEDDSSMHYSDEEGADPAAKLQAFADHLMEFEEEWNGIKIDSDETAMRVAKEELANNPGVYDVYLNYHNPYVRNYKQSTDIYYDILDSFDESIIDPEDYENEDDYEEDRWMYMDEHFYETIDTAVRRAYDSLEENYEFIDGPFVGDLVSEITAKAAEGSLTWDDIADVVFTSTDVTLMRDDWYDSEYGATEMTRAIIEGFGYDAIEDKEVDSKFGQLSRDMMTGTEHIIVFKPEQIKLSDAITYAEDGSIIPLSERFNPAKDDIRYSLPTTDARGTVLSDGQMEYFKDSKARDVHGKLAVVYHSTGNGGFTIFDPSYSDDHRSLFFTDNYDMSRSYIRGGEDFNPYEFSMPDASGVKNLQDVKAYFDSLYDEKDDYLTIMLFDDENKEYGNGFWNEGSIEEYIEKYGEDYAEASGRFVDMGGSVMGEFSSTEELISELKEAVEYINKNYIGGEQGMTEAGTYECYLDLKDPMIIDCKGRNWDSIIDDLFEELFISYDGESFYVDGTSTPWTLDEIRDQYGPGFADAAEEWIENAPEEDLEIGDTIYTYDGDAFDPEVEGYPFEQNTREWCETAYEMGCDGVIFRDLMDNGPHGYGSLSGDVYVAFSSEQVKDVRNLNPTENPDIRYSIVDEDETMSDIAYEDAMDDSYEALLRYERLYDMAESEAEMYFAEAADEEDVAKFYAALNSDEAVVFSDPILEEGRVRIAKSKSEFYNSVNAKWRETWTTGGEVLDLKSVEKQIRNLVKDAMRNSDTDAQYRQEIVRHTLLDVREAYQLMKQDRSDIASSLLYHSAQSMISNLEFIQDDGTFEEYKAIRSYLHATRITLDDRFWNEETFLEFRKDHFGTLRLAKGNKSDVDKIYQELEEQFPGVFNESEREKLGLGDAEEDLLEHIGYVVDQNVKPFMVAYSSEEAAELAFNIADQLYDIMASGRPIESIGDQLDSEGRQRLEGVYKDMESAEAEHQKETEALRSRYDERIESMKRDHQSDLDMLDYQTKMLKVRHEEALKKLTERKDAQAEKKIAKLKERQKQKEQRRKERAEHRKYYERITRHYDWFVERLVNPTKEKNIPVELQQSLAELLMQIDTQTNRSKKLEEKYGPAKKTLRMRELKDAIAEIAKADGSGDLPYNSWLNSTMEELTRQFDGTPIDSLDTADLMVIAEVLKTIRHGIINHKKIKVMDKTVEAQQVRDEVGRSAEEYKKLYGDARTYGGIRGVLDKILNMAEVTPIYFFERIGGMYTMYKEIRRGFDTYVRNEAEIIGKLTKIFQPYYTKKKNSAGSEIENWRGTETAHTFNFENGSITLSIAQMMSVYCHSKRMQSMGHMMGDGVVASPIAPASKIAQEMEKWKGRVDNSQAVVLTEANIQEIISELTPEQIKMAEDLQNLMSEDMAKLGNEASVELYDIELFKDPDYFPLHVLGDVLSTDPNNIDIREKIKNPSFSKPLTPGARNVIVIEDIFSVVATHCNDMNLYNAYAVPISDFMKVYNGRIQYEDGTTGTVKQALRGAYSEKAIKYIEHFIDDINGNSMHRNGGLEDVLNQALSKAKTAAVFGNIRVALQQPTAIVRALAVMDAKYFAGVRPSRKATQEMIDHCPIACWKNWGFYDTHFGRDMEDVMLNKWSKMETAMTYAYGALDNLTWGMIWQAVKKEVKAQNPNVKEGTQEFWDLCNERASEVFDKTQVVDSPMHRSDAMRSKDTLIKQMTSFQAEPTLSLNVLRDGVIRTYEAVKKGDIATATKILSRVVTVWVAQAAVVGGAAAIADALRGKGDDDKEPKDFLELWWMNFMANFTDGLNPINNVYLVKDIVPPIINAMKGEYVWGSSNLMFQWVDTLTTGITQFKKKLEKGDDYKKSWYDVMTNLLGGLGYLTGVPVKTMMRDVKGIANWANKLFGIQIDIFAADGTEEAEKKSLQLTGVKDGSTFDNILNHFGINLSEREQQAREEERAAKERQEKVDKIAEKAANLTGSDKDKKVWSEVSTYIKDAEGVDSYKDLITKGDYRTLDTYRDMYEQAGGNTDYFDERIAAESKKALKKSIKYEPTDDEIAAQQNIKDYLTANVMSEEELSQMVYKSDTAKDLKIAFRINDEDAMVEALIPMIRAGLTYEDYVKLYENRNRIDINKYKSNGGRFADRLKSTGTYIWPTQGTITSHFGRRSAPTAGASSYHQAIDIGAAQGTEVVAADGGVVVEAGPNGGYGNSIGIKHDDGTITYYNHLYSWNVKVGDTVAQGQQIAQVGSTGVSTGPHLDFRIYRNGKYLDPEDILQ